MSTFEWGRSSPGDAGVDAAELQRVVESLAGAGTHAYLVVKDDRIIAEWYAPGMGPGNRHGTASLAKALVGGMSLLVAMSDGLIRPDDPACRYIPAWRDDPVRSRITIRHLATHTSGIEDAEEPGKRHEELTGWKGAFWARKENPFHFAIHEAPVLFEPGTGHAYSNPGMAALAYAVTAAIQNGPHKDIRTLLRRRIMEPLGVPDSEWEVGYGATYEMDGLPLVANWGGGSFSARATARVGRLMMHRGEWEGKQVIDPNVVDEALRDAGTAKPDRSSECFPSSGLGWYVNEDGVWPEIPRDAFAGAGAQHKTMIAVPSLDLIVVRYGGRAGMGPFWNVIVEKIYNPTIAAVSGAGRKK